MLASFVFWLVVQGTPSSYHDTFLAAWRALDAGDVASAVSSLETCLELSPENPNCAYYLACAEAKGGDRDAALAWLQRAAEWGYRDRAMLSWDEDLAVLRDIDAFAHVLRRISAPPAATPAEIVFLADLQAQCSPDGARLFAARWPFGWDLRTGRVGIWPGACSVSQQPLRAVQYGKQPPEVWIPETNSWLMFEDERLRARRHGEVLWELTTRGWGFGSRNLVVHPSGFGAVYENPHALRVFDLETGEILRSLHGPVTSARTVMSLDGRRFASACRDGSVRVWRAEDGEDVARFQQPAVPAYEIALGPDGRRVFVSDSERVAWIYDVDEGEVLARIEHTTRGSFSPDGSRIVTWGLADGERARLWDADTAGLLAELEGDVNVIAWRPDGRLFVGGGASERLYLWDAGSGERRRAFPFDDSVSCLDFHRDGTVAVGGGKGSVHVVNVRTGRETHTFMGNAMSPAAWVDDVELDAEGKRLLVGCNLDAYVWDLEEDRRLWVYLFGAATIAPMRAHFSPDGRTVLVSGRGRWTECLLSATGGEVLADLGPLSIGVGAFTPDGRWIVAASSWTRFVDPGDFRVRWHRLEVTDGGTVRHEPSLHFVAEREDAARVFLTVGGEYASLDCYSPILLDPKKVRASLDGVDVAPVELPPLPVLRVEPDSRFVRAEDGRARLRGFSNGDVLRFEVRHDGELLLEEGPALDLDLPFDDVLDLEIRAVDTAGVMSLPHLVTFHRSEEPPVF